MKRPGYREAIWWLAGNDDNDWLDDEYCRLNDGTPTPSITACLVIDLFDVPVERFVSDLRRAIAKCRSA